MKRKLSISPDGKTLATTAGLSQVLYLWDTQTGKPLHAYPDCPEDDLLKIVVSKDGQRVAAICSDETVRLWDASTGKQGKLLDRWKTWNEGLALAPDGKRLACSEIDGSVACYDLGTHKQLWKEQLTDFAASGLSFSPDSRLIACAHGNRKGRFQAGGPTADCVMLWDAATGKQVGRIPANLGGFGGLVAFAPDGATVYVHGWRTDVYQLDIKTGKQLRHVVFPGRFTEMVPQHRLLLSGALSGTVVLTDLEKGTQIGNFEVCPGQSCAVALSPDGKHLATAPSGYSSRKPVQLAVRELSTKKVVRTIDLPDGLRITNLQFTPDGKQLVTGTLNCTILFWDWQTGAQKGGK